MLYTLRVASLRSACTYVCYNVLPYDYYIVLSYLILQCQMRVCVRAANAGRRAMPSGCAHHTARNS